MAPRSAPGWAAVAGCGACRHRTPRGDPDAPSAAGGPAVAPGVAVAHNRGAHRRSRAASRRHADAAPSALDAAAVAGSPLDARHGNAR